MLEKQTKFWEDKVSAFKLASIKTRWGMNYFSDSVSPLRADLPKSFPTGLERQCTVGSL